MAQTVPIRLMNLYGSGDALAELEVGFLDQLLPLFQATGLAPRADVEVVRINSVQRFLDYLFFGDVDLIHLSSHGTKKSIQIGEGTLGIRQFRKAAKGEDLNGAVIVNTSCQMASDAWVKVFLDAGALAYIAAKQEIWAKDAAIFAAAFYSAYFGTIHVKKSPLQRAFDSYRMARAAYNSFVPHAGTFYFRSADKPVGKVILPKIKLA